MAVNFLHRFAQWPKPRWLRLILRWIVLAVLPKTIRFEGYRLVVHRADHVIGSALLLGNYEPFETKLFLQTVSPGMVVVDCGANIGIYTCLASGRVGPGGKVYAFEPEARNFQCLSETIRLNRLENVQAELLALSDRDGETDLFLSDMNMGGHKFQDFAEGRESVRIATRTLDSYWGPSIRKIDVLKMDIEGAEGLALAGMKQTILKSSNLKIFVEFWPCGLIRCGTNPRTLLEEFLAYGFSIQIIDQFRHTVAPLMVLDELLASDREEIIFDLFLER